VCYSKGNPRLPCKTFLELKGVKPGQKLNILVESNGRQTFPTITDPKGILSNVTLSGKPLFKWLQCGLEFNLLRSEALRLYRAQQPPPSLPPPQEGVEEAPLGPALYALCFTTHMPWAGFHTFFDSRNWTKGMLIINGFNLGRYWPEIGPQMTLYVPGAVFHSGEESDVIVMEMGENANASTAQRSIEFVGEPIFEYKADGGVGESRLKHHYQHYHPEKSEHWKSQRGRQKG